MKEWYVIYNTREAFYIPKIDLEEYKSKGYMIYKSTETAKQAYEATNELLESGMIRYYVN